MTLPPPEPSANETAAEKPPARVKRREMTIGHWLMIVILAALCVDIGIRIVAFRRASLATAQGLAAQKAMRQFLDDISKTGDETQKILDDSKKTQELLEQFDKRLRQNPPAPRDPSKGNIIPLEYPD